MRTAKQWCEVWAERYGIDFGPPSNSLIAQVLTDMEALEWQLEFLKVSLKLRVSEGTYRIILNAIKEN